ncbi:tyrosine-protein phosphatase [Amycolatopsis sp. K13G38]|uniref:Tyrosine-protein phosphatase n=1 Tax=Amycolatopsis acididurans TaxID=2724524 RepID=A0ABX1JCH4_9PSEU|nr:tyrosine-protein phosphatase [Amycolatopsis acididurans]NKQ57492.1 tyrosine-protein phosphatase [Amycolatopsis acididurans]
MNGFYNTRDLGGLPTLNGGRTRYGAYIRSADPRFVTAAGWRASGVSTIVDLRNDDERGPGTGIPTVHVPLDDVADRRFWQDIGDLICCPLYYPAFLAHKAERCAAAITALARAEPAALFHCRAGRDRTGLVAILLLGLAGATPQAIAEDYLRSTAAVKPLFEKLGEPDQGPLVERILARENTTARAAVEAVVAGLDAQDYLLAAGVDAAHLETIRTRLT